VKAQEAHKLLEGYIGDALCQEACKLYRQEVDNLISARSHGKLPTSGLIDGAIKQVNDWFMKVAKGLPWDIPDLPGKIIEWERDDVWVKHNIIDPILLKWRKGTQREILKGTPLPILAAMKPGFLEAASSMMMANIRKGFKEYEELEKKRKLLAAKMGKKVCPFGVDKRFCEHQETYSLAGDIPTSIDQLVFVCKIDKCIEEGGE